MDLQKEKKKLLRYCPSLPMKAPPHPHPLLPSCAHPPSPGTGCRTIHRPLNSCRPPAQCDTGDSGSSHAPGNVRAVAVGFAAASEAAPEPHKEICQPPPSAGSEKSWRNSKRSNTAPFPSFRSQTKAKQADVINFLKFYLEISSRNTGQ